ESLVLHSPLASLPSAWAAVFARLGAAGTSVTEVTDPAETTSSRCDRVLVRPYGPLAAADEVAAALARTKSLSRVGVIGCDAILDAALARHGLPRLGGAYTPASAALVRLVIEAAFEPMDPADLHALLCLDPGPVPRRVSVRLIRALARFPARRSTRWRDALADGLARCDPLWRDAVAKRFTTLLEAAAPRDGRVQAAEIGRRLLAIAGWARGRAESAPSLLGVARMATAARELIERRASELSLAELRCLCDELD